MPKPKITWGPGGVFVLTFTDNLDQRLGWSDLRNGHQTALSPSQAVAQQAWIYGTDQRATVSFRYIKRAQWDGTYGVKAWLAYARGLNPFTFYPDETVPGVSYSCYLEDPMTGAVALDDDGVSYRLDARFRTVDGSPFDTF
jgi:hypothetical protein